MAKGQVTDDELASGLKNFGGFGSLGGAKPRREDPFRDTRAEAPAAAPARAESPRIEIVKTPEVSAPEIKTETAPAPRANPLKLRPKKATSLSPAVKMEKAVKPLKKVSAEAVQTETKSELYTERVTVPLDAELRDGAESLAKELQRKRTEKGERITANTVMRVALRVMLEKFDAGEAVVNTEGELYEAVSQKVFKK